MKPKNRLLASVLCFLMVVFCVVGLTACGGDDKCSHQWGEWSTTKNATCTEAGSQERKCSECGETETSTIAALGHDWNEATCSTPKTCKVCSATEGTASAHAYTVETVKDEALKSAATSTSAAVYYKSCSCGAVSTNDADTFTNGDPIAHSFSVETVKDEALKSAATCTSAAVYYKSCSCGAVSTNDADTFTNGSALDHVDANKDHACDYNCGENVGTCADANKDHACDYGCNKAFGEHADGDDNNHLCDYGCGKIADEGCYDTVVDGKCDECSADINHTCVDTGKDHACDICSTPMGEHSDGNKDHNCDYGCADKIGTCADADKDHDCDYGCEKVFGTCEDADKDHDCDYGCEKVFGTCEDADKDHDCDYGCTKTFGEHTDGNDNNHLCDYGCGRIADEGCYDTVVDGKCDECSADIDHDCVDENKNHACDICSADMGEHIDANKDHTCDYGCSNEIGNCVDTDKDHACDYGCDEIFGTCEDADFDHACDYGCDKVLGTCEDKNKDHECDHGCEKPFGEHSDSNTDNDHVCDYGCGAVIESCSDAEDDGDHNCDVCNNADITDHSFSNATCGAPATCSECGATTGSTLEHEDENHDHICDNDCGKTDMGNHSDSDTDNDHVCDYGCGAVLENCSDVETDDDHDCDVCNKVNVTFHAHVENTALATEATCETAATKTYECNCGDTYTEDDGDALGHNITGAVATERHVNGCEYVLVYVCQSDDCGEEVLGETVYHHNYVASIKTPATCTTPGEKTFECSACGDTSKEAEPIPADATGHNWTTGNVVDGVRIDTCSVCSETKTVTVYTGNKTDEVNAEDLADKEIELNDANISLDSGVIDTIGDQNITVSADKLEGDDRTDLGLSEDQLAQVGDSPIYNFTINNGTENISNFGEENYVTITLPYTLTPGEDVDSIAVWFINDEGELESIPATYNNGYVTFKTNHFSYYTVTRLTPAERCALYGHGYVCQHVEGSCTKDAYDLYVCVRCHDKYIDEDTLVIADGHDYTSETHNATCTENGYVIYACNDCDHSYRTKINATGHSWSEIDSGEVSCTVDGFIKYGCDNCDEEYTVTYVKTGHVYTNTVVPATCAADGYTIHDCDNCDYSYTDTYVDALGHNYGAGEWTWEANGNKATLTLVCEHDETHTTALHVISTMEKEVEKGACSNYVIRTHTATVEYNGVTYTDVMVIRQGNPTHNFSTDWTADENEHWHECVCGEKIDVAEHTFGNATTTKNPTCDEAGESTSYCTVCGEAKVTTIPATGDHNYVDGFCNTCGKEEVACDHTDLHKESIDLGELGACDWVLYYFTCECGEVKVLDQNSDIDCALDEVYEEDEYIDENGNTVMTMKGACHCGLEVIASAVVTVDGCTETYASNYTFKFNGEVVIEMNYVEDHTWHGNEERATIDLSEYGACGGSLIVYKCADCGEITNIYDFDVDCNVDFENEPEVEQITDENGVVHYIQKVECPDCDLALVVDMWVDEVSVCETITYMTMTVRYGETKIVELYDTEYDDNHEYEYEYELEGESCEDGVKITGHCTICGDSYSTSRNWHSDVEYDVVIDLSEHSTCGGTINVDRCSLCGYITDINDMNINCNMSDEVEEEITDAEGNVIGYKYISTCPDCGLMFVEQEWIETHSVCEYTEYEGAYIYKGEECIFAYVEGWYESDHEYEYTYEAESNDCNERYKVIEHCTVCGKTDEWYTSGHRSEEFEMNLADHNGCEGTISGRRCAICGEITSLYDMNVGCDINGEATPDELVDENGVTHYITTMTCPDCGLTFVAEMWEIQESACVTQQYQVTKIYSGEDCIFEYTYAYSDENHNYEYSYELEGETCEDGYIVTHYCTICGESDYWWSSGHRYESFEIDWAEHGGCSGILYGERCSICEKIINVHHWDIGCELGETEPVEVVDENGITHYVTTQTCPNCGLKFVTDAWTTVESVCVSTEHALMTVYSGENIIFEYEQTYVSENHEYEITYDMQGDDCEDGYYVNVYCPICGESERYHDWGHNSEWREVDLGEFGLCGGLIEERYCPICDTVLHSNINDNCYWEFVETNADGYAVYECQNCGAMKLTCSHDTEKDDNCEYQHTEIAIYIVNGEEVYRYERTYWYQSHKYQYEYILNGSSCTDGYRVITTCENCDYHSENTSNYHETFVVFEMIADEGHEGVCNNHYVSVHSCPCGQEFYIDFERYSFRFDEELQMYVCDNCDLTILYNITEVEEGCSLIVTTNFAVYYDGEELYSVNKEEAYANHNFTDVQVSVVDGVTYITTSCDKCDAVNSTEILSVELEQHNGEYYYDYTFTPDESAVYSIVGLADRDTYVTLYKMVGDQLVELSRDDDGAGDYNQFLLSYNLTEGTTYVYRIRFYNSSNSGSISFAITKGAEEVTVCRHNSSKEFSVLLNGSETCEDGALYGRICTECGCIDYVRVEHQHITIMKDRVDLAENGACYGEFVYYSCACGQEHDMYLRNACYDTWTDNEYYDDEGRLIHVDVHTCSECGLRYTRSYYTVKDRASCTLTYYYTVVINVGGNLIAEMDYTVVEVNHDYEVIGTLMNGAGSSCEDGVVITYKCKDCEHEESYETYYHETYEKEHIDLSDLGSVCGGYATVYGCACGEHGSLSLDHSLCELGSEWCELWIEDAITEGQYTINGWNSFGYNSYLYICAVTDPEDAACAYKIRCARYWLKDENSCMAYRYETWQFGYNEETGTYEYAVTFKTGSSRVYHNYVDGSTDNHVKYDCPDCGSYYYENRYYDDNYNCTKYENLVSNTLDNGSDKYYEYVEEYAFDANGNRYVSREYTKSINSDGIEYWYEELREEEVYVGAFGDPGRKVSYSYMNSEGESYSEEYAYVWYKGYDFREYTYGIEGDYWYRHDYTYTFDNGCVQKEVYTNSEGVREENTNDICRFWNYVTIKNPTCSQDGEECRECKVCGKHTESYTVSPHDHNWVQITDNWYFCFTCGLENANGVSGDIIMEDLTDAYGNGEYYVVGYYARNNVEFSKYVSLVLADGTTIDVLTGIEFTTIDGIRAYAFRKADVEAWAAENGYTDFDVRFSFVPVGSDGSFDYGVTFTEPTVVTETIVDNVSFTDYIGAGETKSYTITPTEDGVWTFTSFSDHDTYATLCDANGNTLDSDDDDGQGLNFKITYELKAGETYIITVRWYDSNDAGNVPLLFGTAPVIA